MGAGATRAWRRIFGAPDEQIPWRWYAVATAVGLALGLGLALATGGQAIAAAAAGAAIAELVAALAWPQFVRRR